MTGEQCIGVLCIAVAFAIAVWAWPDARPRGRSPRRRLDRSAEHVALREELARTGTFAYDVFGSDFRELRIPLRGKTYIWHYSAEQLDELAASTLRWADDPELPGFDQLAAAVVVDLAQGCERGLTAMLADEDITDEHGQNEEQG
jgi:hypothetical protein